ncbi:MAG TPA: DUF4430 domain-containing protein [Solirubrobacterales bacterium]|nr:DUF4430 domain-containing protein [Solirubrobacterales bacterium]
MSRRRCSAASIALLGGAIAVAGCGLGPGRGLSDVRLTVTRDYGAKPVLERAVGGVTESDTAMRVLERSTQVSTRYGGGFVQAIDGTEGEDRGGASYDWFFYVNGVESSVGAAAYALHGGEAIWWDYRDWSAAMAVPAVVGSWPEPFTGGYEGKRHPVSLECMGGGGPCAEVRSRLEIVGVPLAAGSPSGAIRVLVGPWARVRSDPAAAQIEAGPQASGVFAQLSRRGGGFSLKGLGEDGKVARSFGPGTGLVAATRRFEAPPTWIITGVSPAGVRAAAGLLDIANLRDHYAVAIEAGKETPLPATG